MGRKRIRQALPAMGSRAAEQGDGARRGAEARCARHRAPRLIPNAFCGTETLRCLAPGTGRSIGGLSRLLNTPVQL
jgi:hypothetical protein